MKADGGALKTTITAQVGRAATAAVSPELPVQYPTIPSSPGIEDLGQSVKILGVELSKGKGGANVPDIERFRDNVLTEWDIKLMQKIAVGLDLNQAVLIEGGSGIGKSEAVDRVCAYLNRESYYTNCAKCDVETLIGGKTLDDKGAAVRVDGPAMQAIRNGGVLILDE